MLLVHGVNIDGTDGRNGVTTIAGLLMGYILHRYSGLMIVRNFDSMFLSSFFFFIQIQISI